MKTKAMTTLTLSILLLVLCGIYSGAYAGDPLPDLIVRELRTNERCQIVVTVANQGPGVLPDNAWPSSLLAIGLRGAVAGTVPLATVDPGRQLRVPGGTATYVSRFTVPAAGAPVDAVVDNNNKVAEANEGNNTLARGLTCAAASVTPPPSPGTGTTAAGAASPPASGQLPDLIIRDIRLNKRCEIVVTAANQGPGRVPDAVWTTHTPNSSSVYLTIDGRPWGGEIIWKFDPMRALQHPGGTASFTAPYVVRARATVQATIDQTTQVAEANERNNQRVETLACQGGPASGQLPGPIITRESATPPPGGIDKANPMPPVTTPGAGKGGAPNKLLPAVAPAPAAGAAAVQAVKIEQLSKAQFKALPDDALLEIEGRKIRKADVVAEFKRRAAAARAGATVHPSGLAAIQARIRAEEDAAIAASAAEVRKRLAEIRAQGGDR